MLQSKWAVDKLEDKQKEQWKHLGKRGGKKEADWESRGCLQEMLPPERSRVVHTLLSSPEPL